MLLLQVPRFSVFIAVLALLVMGILFAQGFVLAQDADSTETKQLITVDPGAGTEFISPDLWIILQQQANAEEGLPTNLNVDLIYANGSEQAISTAIKAAGGTNVQDDIWKIPTNKVLPIIQRSDVYSAGLNRLERRASTSGSGSMDAILTNVTAAHNGGIPANQAVLYGYCPAT